MRMDQARLGTARHKGALSPWIGAQGEVGCPTPMCKIDGPSPCPGPAGSAFPGFNHRSQGPAVTVLVCMQVEPDKKLEKKIKLVHLDFPVATISRFPLWDSEESKDYIDVRSRKCQPFASLSSPTPGSKEQTGRKKEKDANDFDCRFHSDFRFEVSVCLGQFDNEAQREENRCPSSEMSHCCENVMGTRPGWTPSVHRYIDTQYINTSTWPAENSGLGVEGPPLFFHHSFKLLHRYKPPGPYHHRLFD
ncbi:hypothetical protein ACRALDRAFT_205667 [Sodiomyces alcalophilus JCM 7366]|uniref:uncharacterized protein n=1 Tax=Sodiomyces alcalophilus JCM 7366 TaxID=591952 RepID=UPI0039B4B8EA